MLSIPDRITLIFRSAARKRSEVGAIYSCRAVRRALSSITRSRALFKWNVMYANRYVTDAECIERFCFTFRRRILTLVRDASFGGCNIKKKTRFRGARSTRTRQHSENVRIRTVAGSHEEKGNGALSVGGASGHLRAPDWLYRGRASEAPLALIKHFGTPTRVIEVVRILARSRFVRQPDFILAVSCEIVQSQLTVIFMQKITFGNWDGLRLATFISFDSSKNRRRRL